MRMRPRNWRDWGAGTSALPFRPGLLKTQLQWERDLGTWAHAMHPQTPHEDAAARWGVAMADGNPGGSLYPATVWPVFPSFCWRRWTEAPIE